jgi:hypothetical protein
LDGVTTADGLAGGTNYFWVELIDARGNTAGPQPVGSYTAPTVWEFYMHILPENYNLGIHVIQISSSTFTITPQNMFLHTFEIIYPTEYDALVAITYGIVNEGKRTNFREAEICTNYGQSHTLPGPHQRHLPYIGEIQCTFPGYKFFAMGC